MDQPPSGILPASFKVKGQGWIARMILELRVCGVGTDLDTLTYNLALG